MIGAHESCAHITLQRGRQTGYDQVDIAALQRREQIGERHFDNLELNAKRRGQQAGEIHVKANNLAVPIGDIERWLTGGHTDPQRAALRNSRQNRCLIAARRNSTRQRQHRHQAD